MNGNKIKKNLQNNKHYQGIIKKNNKKRQWNILILSILKQVYILF